MLPKFVKSGGKAYLVVDHTANQQKDAILSDGAGIAKPFISSSSGDICYNRQCSGCLLQPRRAYNVYSRSLNPG
jgi:hypothetical protein